MSGYNRKGKYLSAEMRFKYNPKTKAIDVTTVDEDLSDGGFLFTIPVSSKPGEKIMRRLFENNPQLREALNTKYDDIFGRVATRTPGQWPNEPEKIPLGLDEYGEEVFWDVDLDAHFIITGRPGSGKTTMQQAIVEHLSQFVNSWRIYAYEPFGNFSGKGDVFHNLNGVQYDHSLSSALKNAISWLEIAVSTIEERRRLLAAGSSKNFSALKTPRLLMIFDDADHLLDEESVLEDNNRELQRRIRDLLLLVAYEGKQFGVHLMLGLHDTRLLAEDILPLMSLVASFGDSNSRILHPALGYSVPLSVPTLPVGAAFIRGLGVNRSVNVPVLTKTYIGSPHLWQRA